MGTVDALLSAARGELGVSESPAGSNRTKYGRWYGLDGNPWCMMFVMWCFDRAGVSLPKRTASCGDLMRAAQAQGCWVTVNFQPGDVVVYDFSGKRTATQHCGIVEAVLPDYVDSATAASSGSAEFNRAQPLNGAAARYVQAIEGNTSASGSQDNGGMVCRKNRAQKYIIGAVRPRFDAEKEDNMTGKEIYDALQEYLAGQSVPDWAKEELEEAVRLGITDGANAMQLIPRYQAAVMALRAVKKN